MKIGLIWAVFGVVLVVLLLWAFTEPIGILLLIVVLGIAVVRALSNTKEVEERKHKRLTTQQKFIVENNITVSSEMVYEGIRIIIHEPN